MESTASCSSPVRGIWGGGRQPTRSDTIDYVTIASLGDAIDFGNLSAATQFNAAVSNSIRGVFAGGQDPAATNDVEYITIDTIGNVTDFGDLTNSAFSFKGCSDSHGGLG
jgi:hypothetical protein